MDENAERMQELGSRWFEALTLPKGLMSEMTAAVGASQQDAREKRQREREAEEAKSVEPAKPAAKVNAELTIANPWPWCEGELVRLYDEKQLRAAYTKMQRVATADREKTKNRLTTIEHIAARGAFRKCGIPVDWAARLTGRSATIASYRWTQISRLMPTTIALPGCALSRSSK